MVVARTASCSLILIFRREYESGNETVSFAYQGYVARVCTFSSIHVARGSIVPTALAVLTSVGLFFAGDGDAHAYAVKKTSRGELVHWEERTVKYTVDPSVNLNVTRANDAAMTAMQSWSGTVGSPELTIAANDADSPTKPGFDEKNGVFFMKGGYAPAGRALAITVLTYDNASGRILDADVIFNGSYTFKVLAAPGDTEYHETTTHLSNTDGVVHQEESAVTQSTTQTVYDLHHVIAHELGHSLGMNDEMGRKDALMYRYSSPNDATIRQPNADDIAGLAELYSTKLEGRGNGCGSATVAPKKPSSTASHAATFATLGLLLFLVLRARSDRRARVGFVSAAAAATIALVPVLSGAKGNAGVARASDGEGLLGHARAKVLSTSTAIESGLFKTNYELVTTECRTNGCPKASHGAVWGGSIGNLTQEVGGQYAPLSGDDVEVSFKVAPNAFGSLIKPLAGRPSEANAEVRVLTRIP